MTKFKFIAKDKILYLPKSPGVYAFRKEAKLLYIGKAANLRERVKNHFHPVKYREAVILPKAKLFNNRVKKIGYIKTDSDIEALILEAKLIKKYKPKYNIVWRDDKNYFYVGITKEKFPTVLITHQPGPESGISNIEYRMKKHSKFKIQHSKFYYVGPFVEGKALKQALNILRRVFPYRTCKSYSGKPCPPKFLDKPTKTTKSIEVQKLGRACPSKFSFRKLGRACLWYQLGRCPGPCLLGSKLANEMPELEITIKKESQRNARNLKKILEGSKNQVLKSLKKEMKEASKIKEFERAAKIRDQINALERVLSHARVLEMIEAKEGNWEGIERKIKKNLNIKRRVSRIEAYDISNIQGKNATGSMVTFINGKPDKNLYRKFKIKLSHKPDDVAMIKETLLRRFQHFEWGLPDLILIDGGIAQLSAALKIKNKIGEIKSIRFLSLAKKENKLFIENQKEPVLLKNLPREIFNLILQLRDEAHRFAIFYHRKLREEF